MPDFSHNVKEVLKNYVPDGVFDSDFWGGLSKKYRELVLSLSKKSQSAEKLSKVLSITVKLFPVLAGITVAILFNNKEIVLGTWLGVTFIIFYFFLIAIEALFPKDLTPLNADIKLIERERSLQILATQLTFYAGLQNISHVDNEERISKLSLKLDKELTDAIEKEKARISVLIDPAKPNSNVQESSVQVANISPGIYSSLNPVAELIYNACTVLFGPAKYSIKIYLRTKHKIKTNSGEREVQMLTSLVKYPRKSSASPTSGGRSWIKCRGEVATAWKCVDGGEEVICRQRELRRDSPQQHYPSIAYIKLPEGIGVLTIVSSEKSTFVNEKSITEDVKRTFMIATNVMTKEALAKFE